MYARTISNRDKKHESQSIAITIKYYNQIKNITNIMNFPLVLFSFARLSPCYRMNVLLEKVSLYYIIIFCAIPSNVWTRHSSRYDYAERDTDLSLWINEQQVKMFSGNFNFNFSYLFVFSFDSSDLISSLRHKMK